MDKPAQHSELFRTVAHLPPAELAAFLAVAQHGGFRSAARSCGASASAVSHAVASLERRLNIQLFQRTTRNVSLTDPGQRFFLRLAPALDEIAKAIDELTDRNAMPAGTLRINADAVAAEQVIAPLILQFLRRYPQMRVEIITDRRLVDIAEHGFDCGIRASDLVQSDMIAVPIGPMQQHIVVAAPTYLKDAPVLDSPADLASHLCIQLRMPAGVLYRWEFERRSESYSIETQGALVLDNTRLILAAAVEGSGLGYITKWMAGPALERGELVQLLGDWTPPYPGLCLYYSRHRHLNAGMKALVSFAREQLGRTEDSN